MAKLQTKMHVPPELTVDADRGSLPGSASPSSSTTSTRTFSPKSFSHSPAERSPLANSFTLDRESSPVIQAIPLSPKERLHTPSYAIGRLHPQSPSSSTLASDYEDAPDSFDLNLSDRAHNKGGPNSNKNLDSDLSCPGTNFRDHLQASQTLHPEPKPVLKTTPSPSRAPTAKPMSDSYLVDSNGRKIALNDPNHPDYPEDHPLSGPGNPSSSGGSSDSDSTPVHQPQPRKAHLYAPQGPIHGSTSNPELAVPSQPVVSHKPSQSNFNSTRSLTHNSSYSSLRAQQRGPSRSNTPHMEPDFSYPPKQYPAPQSPRTMAQTMSARHTPTGSVSSQHPLSHMAFGGSDPYLSQHSGAEATAAQNNLPMPPRRRERPMSARSSISSMGDINGGSSSASLSGMGHQSSASMFDLSQSYLTQLGANQATLMPRIKTIELYRKNAKKSNDPAVQYQFAQYLLQTALMAGANKHSPTSSMSSAVSNMSPLPSPARDESPRRPGKMDEDRAAEKLKQDLLKEAIVHLRRLVDRGHPDAQYLLGDAYFSGAFGKPDLKDAYTLFQMASKHGHPEATYRAALCLEEGWGCSKDTRKAVQMYRAAASKQHVGAMFRLGMACFYSLMGIPNIDASKLEGVKWLSRAAENASELYPRGPFELAKIYEVGYKDLIIKDNDYAVQLYVRSADLNFAPAASLMGHAYEHGTLNCPQDPALSIHYYTVGATAGDEASMLAMCAWYMVGADPILPQDEDEGFEWAKKAADAGYAKAQFVTGYFLEQGIGTDRDILQSSVYYRKAAAGGDERAIERLKKGEARQVSGQSIDNSGDKAKGKKKSKDAKEGKGGKGGKDDKDCVIM
ncbi:Protein SKT5 [Yarrowia sp. B02]|nr:Protein SKT5 [Yarrowia sp. B02]